MQKKSYSTPEQLAMVEQSPYNIQFIEAPSEEAQMKAVAQCWQTFRLIDKPSPKIKLLIP